MAEDRLASRSTQHSLRSGCGAVEVDHQPLAGGFGEDAGFVEGGEAGAGFGGVGHEARVGYHSTIAVELHFWSQEVVADEGIERVVLPHGAHQACVELDTVDSVWRHVGLIASKIWRA